MIRKLPPLGKAPGPIGLAQAGEKCAPVPALSKQMMPRIKGAVGIEVKGSGVDFLQASRSQVLTSCTKFLEQSG